MEGYPAIIRAMCRIEDFLDRSAVVGHQAEHFIGESITTTLAIVGALAFLYQSSAWSVIAALPLGWGLYRMHLSLENPYNTWPHWWDRGLEVATPIGTLTGIVAVILALITKSHLMAIYAALGLSFPVMMVFWIFYLDSPEQYLR